MLVVLELEKNESDVRTQEWIEIRSSSYLSAASGICNNLAYSVLFKKLFVKDNND